MSMILKCLQYPLFIEIANLQCSKPAQGGKLKNVMYFCSQLVLGWLTAPSSPSLLSLLNTALQVWILCSQRDGGPCDWWILGKLESLWNLLQNMWRRHQNRHQRVQPTRVSPEVYPCCSKGILQLGAEKEGAVAFQGCETQGTPTTLIPQCSFSFQICCYSLNLSVMQLILLPWMLLKIGHISFHPRVWDSMFRVSKCTA